MASHKMPLEILCDPDGPGGWRTILAPFTQSLTIYKFCPSEKHFKYSDSYRGHLWIIQSANSGHALGQESRLICNRTGIFIYFQDRDGPWYPDSPRIFPMIKFEENTFTSLWMEKIGINGFNRTKSSNFFVIGTFFSDFIQSVSD